MDDERLGLWPKDSRAAVGGKAIVPVPPRVLEPKWPRRKTRVDLWMTAEIDRVISRSGNSRVRSDKR